MIFKFSDFQILKNVFVSFLIFTFIGFPILNRRRSIFCNREKKEVFQNVFKTDQKISFLYSRSGLLTSGAGRSTSQCSESYLYNSKVWVCKLKVRTKGADDLQTRDTDVPRVTKIPKGATVGRNTTR